MIKKDDIIVQDINFENDQNETNLIVQNTKNTWQKDRTLKEKNLDTKIGKIAESEFEKYVNNYDTINSYQYISYDSFRNDNYKNHAPFDGLYLSKNIDEKSLNTIKNDINNALGTNKFGKLNTLKKIREEWKKNNLKIFIVEIKSTRLLEKNKTDEDLNFNIIGKQDFLIYPSLKRQVNSDIYNHQNKYNTQDYLNDSKKITNKNENDILINEKFSTPDLLIRVYIDEKENKSHIIGFINAKEFNQQKKIKQMITKKSENAIYWTVPLKFGNPINKLIKKEDLNLKLLNRKKNKY
jgi:hypothetical protein